MIERRGLWLGCGHRELTPAISVRGIPPAMKKVSVDINQEVNPDVVHDLNVLPWPFEDSSFEEIHAYDVLEHLGTQGDARAFFAHFYEIWRILRNGGLLFASVPTLESPWLLAEPSHTRVIALHTLNFLDQKFYEDQMAKETKASDFRYLWKGDFRKIYHEEEGYTLYFVMKAVKEGKDCLAELASPSGRANSTE